MGAQMALDRFDGVNSALQLSMTSSYWYHYTVEMLVTSFSKFQKASTRCSTIEKEGEVELVTVVGTDARTLSARGARLGIQAKVPLNVGRWIERKNDYFFSLIVRLIRTYFVLVLERKACATEHDEYYMPQKAKSSHEQY